MRIPGRLRDTTLGDVFGTLHRAQATGYLELVEVGRLAGRIHRVQFEDGRIVHLDSPTGPRLGELLELYPLSRRPGVERSGQEWLARGLVSTEKLRGALRRQLQLRLEALFTIEDAELRFRAPRPRQEDPTSPSPLGKEDFLVNRPRQRRAPYSPRETLSSSSSPRRATALRVLGLTEGASADDVQRAFRMLAGQLHPDRHPHASAERKKLYLQRFTELSQAYHILTA